MTEVRSRRRRLPFYVNTVVSSLIIVVLAAVALVAQSTSPPSIAEFSPRAQQQIEEAPDEQSADAGAASVRPNETVEAEAADDHAPTGVADRVLDVRVPSALSCVSWPDGSVTQTFDPQSPPCIATWDHSAGNGGATSMGVTATEILVAVPRYSEPLHRLFETFFNTHYQFYGRSIRLVAAPASGDGESGGRAATVAEMQPFAATEVGTGFGPTAEWADPLARAGVITVTKGHASQTRGSMRAHAPFQWSYSPAVDEMERHAARFVCGSLTGRDAEWAGPGSTGPRHFAVTRSVYASSQGVGLLGTMLDGLAACGVEPSIHDYDSSDAQGMTALMAELRAQGVTTILTAGSGDSFHRQMLYAHQVGYQPEWFAPGLPAQYTEWYSSSPSTPGFAPPTQTSHLFGLAPLNKHLRWTSEPWYVAVKSVDPTFEPQSGSEATPYYQLSVLAAGIQMAGPNLTPETFARGLQATRFPNPGAGAAPYYQAAVDYSSGHSAIGDVAVWWFDPAQTRASTGEAGGGLCWIDRGRRWALDQWENDLRPFEGDCR